MGCVYPGIRERPVVSPFFYQKAILQCLYSLFFLIISTVLSSSPLALDQKSGYATLTIYTKFWYDPLIGRCIGGCLSCSAKLMCTDLGLPKCYPVTCPDRYKNFQFKDIGEKHICKQATCVTWRLILNTFLSFTYTDFQI